jgi:ATP-dependent DNA helicase RecG
MGQLYPGGDNVSLVYQRSVEQAREALSFTENNLHLAQSSGSIYRRYYNYKGKIYNVLEKREECDRDKRLGKESTK